MDQRATLIGVFLSFIFVFGQSSAETKRVGDPGPPAPSQYTVEHGWPVLPEDTMFDEVSAVGVDSHGGVFVLTRCGRPWPDSGLLETTLLPCPTIVGFDGQTGKFLSLLGRNLFA